MQEILFFLYEFTLIIIYLPALIISSVLKIDISPYISKDMGVNLMFIAVNSSWIIFFVAFNKILNFVSKPKIEDKYKELQKLNRRTHDRRGQFPNKRKSDVPS